MSNPILVEITRGDHVESIHRGAVVIADADGAVRFACGDVQSAFCPRSALKPLQALPLVESGAADAYGLGDEELALACGSHSGEPMHTERVAAWLKRIGCTADDLACGPQAPRFEPDFGAMVEAGEQPNRLHNNCSGKHAGFLTLARHLGADTAGYVDYGHPVQQAVTAALSRLSGVEDVPHVIDGCAAPNYFLPMIAFAQALARLGTLAGGRRLIDAMIRHPELVAGTKRACTALTQACHGKAAVKTGAEGVFAAILPEAGLGVAVKIDDGASRASETAIATLLIGLGIADESAAAFVDVPILNTRTCEVGRRQAAVALRHIDLTAI